MAPAGAAQDSRSGPHRILRKGSKTVDDIPERSCPLELTATRSNSFTEYRRPRNRDTLSVKPQFVEEIQSLHDEFTAGKWLERVGEDTCDEAIDSAFGFDGSWTLCAAMPEAGMLFDATEAPFALRDWKALPNELSGKTLGMLLEHWGVAAINGKGSKGDGDCSLGQDNLSIARLSNGWEAFAVFDGHGPAGHWASSRAARTISFFLQGDGCRNLLDKGKVEAALRLVFKAIQSDLVAESILQNVDLQISGTTAAVVLRHCSQPFAWVGTAGDSRVVLIQPDRGVIEETSDHKATREDEERRIAASGGDVREKRYSDGFVEKRVYLKGKQYPGLCVTRSLGDCSVKSIGISAEPEVVRWSVPDDETLLLLCSDGVWEFISSREAAQFVLNAKREGGKEQKALDVLYRESVQSWRRNEGESYCDDITMILATLGRLPAPRWNDPVSPEQAKSVMYIPTVGFYPEATRGHCEACSLQ